ncbi:acyltransferase [Mucilaginibacter robiniae]|uniref:Acyltransferase n=1 Tax=Mucilaginibacter robiniae TaxID=2728022 RepID=A0A7L5EAG2_9SPHI|nr:acyltransferase [Mucilaginibacter robiniae]QJD97366.1 acyltransferase [Mucilaginibacter robiniae]
MLLKLHEYFYKKINNLKRAQLFNDKRYNVQVASSFKFNFHLSQFTIKANGAFVAAKNVVFREYCSILIGDKAQLTLGENVFFNRYSSINCFGTITIGDNSIFGEGVKLYDHNHQFRASDRPIWDQGYKIGSITIGKNCWVGANVTILNNVTIGDNVVIGAGCLIYKDVPSNCIVKNKVDHLVEAYR